MRPIRVLSLFDGMSCGQIALRDLGIPIEVYYASEIDKFAIQQTQLNFPGTVQLGDVRNIDVDKLCEDGEIDLLIGGSPCTNLSFAGKRAGLATKENIEMLFLLLTDILSENSYVIYAGAEAENILSQGFNQMPVDGEALLEGVVSRKKQFVPVMMGMLMA